jgi:hypothetical protein
LLRSVPQDCCGAQDNILNDKESCQCLCTVFRAPLHS